MKKFVFGVLIISIILVSTGGYYDAREIAHTVSVIAMGIDKGENMPYRVSFQIERTGTGEGGDSGGSGGSGGSSGEKEKEKSKDVISVEAPTVLSAFSRANSINSVDLSVTNVKMIIFSEDIAKEKMVSAVSEIASATEFKNNSYLSVSMGKAEDILKNVSPEDEEYISVYYEQIILRHYKEATPFFLLSETYFNIISDEGGDFVLPAVAKREEDGFENSFTDDTKSGLIAGMIPKQSKHKVEFLGGAVFSKGELKGYLTESEMLALSFAGSFFAPRDISVNYPEGTDNFITVRLKQPHNSKIKSNPGNVLTTEIEAEFSSSYEYMEKGEYKTFSDEFTAYLEKELSKAMEDVLNKCITEYSSDVLSLKSHAKIHFLTEENLDEYNLPEKMKTGRIICRAKIKSERNGRFTFV